MTKKECAVARVMHAAPETNTAIDAALGLKPAAKELEQLMSEMMCGDVPDDFQFWIYDGEGNYRPQVVLVLAEAEKVRKVGSGYREFRRRVGNYANAEKGVMKDQTNLWIGAILADSPSTPERILELRNECVKVCKFLWKISKQQCVAEPVVN
jgi:hypothetical protein